MQVGYSGTLPPYCYYGAHSKSKEDGDGASARGYTTETGHLLGEALDKVRHSFRSLTVPRMSSFNEQTASAIISKNPSRHVCDVTGAGSTLIVFVEHLYKLQSFHR